ncbi:single-stranded DNA-binding protein [Leifsonia shinshuensis]|uniref:Single-strand DNA-binding protein n=1 Tax=Leifsonia shinshuensis TaxID=150026 RepID=A0A853D0G7_9MICO|nr:single-stranded DNA-binding protein [Leifsonia shinshuensis]NYJ24265.1 single-strand DNA-binding protein [Leifsonia shinshuensis]
MSESVAVRGTVATSPRHVTPEAGSAITSFRLVTDDRAARPAGAQQPAGPGQDPRRGARRDPESNWFTVTAFGELAVSAAACVARGDPLVVTGRLRVRDWAGEQLGVTVEIEAEAIGHDLARGRSRFTRSTRALALTDAPGGRGDPTGSDP